MNPIDSSIVNFYSQSAEDLRLQMGLGPLEFERNKDLISRYLPSHKGYIADIGGGTGHYSQWLAAMGHDVLLVDPVPKHIQQAEKRARSKHPFKCVLGEARKLPMNDNTADVVILHGPLYHLQEEEERIASLAEARRVLKPGGFVLGFAITHAASTLAALQTGMLYEPDIFAMCKSELKSGYHNPPERFPEMLAMAYYHRPSVLRQEFEAAGLKPVGLFAVEGMAWMDGKFFETWSHPEKRKRLLELISITESDPELLCMSPHMMLAAEK